MYYASIIDAGALMQKDMDLPLKGRSREIYLDLCQLLENLPVGCSLPSLRELQRRYSAGQQTVVNALNFLDRNSKLERIPRKKIRVSEESLKKSSVFPDPDAFPGISRSQASDTVLTTIPELAAILQPVVDKFNTCNSAGRIRINAVADLKSVISSAARGDFAFFGNNPVLLGLVSDTSIFLDLGDLTTSLEHDELYDAAFVRSPDGRLWGIAPTLAPPVIFHNGNIDDSLSLDMSSTWNFSDFAGHLEKLRTKHPDLPYIYSTVGYINFLSNWGIPLVDPATGRISLDIELLLEPLTYLKNLVTRKIIPVYSDIFNMGYRTLFNRGQIILREDWINSLETLPENLSNTDVLAFPSDGRHSLRLNSEVFCIMADSMNYDKCWSFINYVLSKESQQYFAGQRRDIPVRKEILPGLPDKKQSDFMASYLNRCERKPEDYFLPQSACYVLEVGIDKWIKYGTELTQNTLKEIEKSCQWYIDNMKWR